MKHLLHFVEINTWYTLSRHTTLNVQPNDNAMGLDARVQLVNN